MRKHRRSEKEQLYQALLAHYVRTKRKRVIRYLILVFMAFVFLLLLFF